MHKSSIDKSSQDAVQHSHICASICIETIQHCLRVGGAHVEASHLRLLQDCIDICLTTTNFLLRSSPQCSQVAAACATICELCAVSCEKLSSDAQMKACAEACRLCVTVCRHLSTQQKISAGMGSGFRASP